MKINKINLALLFSIAFIRPFGFMLYLTSMPALVKYFHTSTGMLLQTLTFYFLGVGVSELYFGFLSDKFGRKRILVIGLFCFSITNFLSIFSCSIMQFIIFRILQGLSFGFTLSVLYACFKDIYSDGKMLSRLITFSETLFGVCAIVAPFLGSFIYVYFSWRGNFMFTSIISIILCILISLFYNNVERKEKIRRNIFTVYKGFLLNKKFMSLAIMCLLACASISIQNAEMPFINSSVLKLAPIFSGFVLFGFGFMYLLGNIANFYFLKVFKIRIIINIIIDIYLALGAVIVLSLFIDNLLFLMLPFMFILFLSGMLFPLNSSLAMLERNKNSGAAGGFIGFSMYIQGAIVTALLGLFKTNSITLSVSLLAVIILIIFTWIIFLNSEAESYS